MSLSRPQLLRILFVAAVVVLVVSLIRGNWLIVAAMTFTSLGALLSLRDLRRR